MTARSDTLTGFLAATILAVSFSAYLTYMTQPRLVLTENDEIEISAGLQPGFEAFLPGFVDFMDDRFDSLAVETDADIDAGVDALFQPVYDALPDYLDAHYSLRGQYGELAAAAFAQFSDESESMFRRILFEQTGFDTAQTQLQDQLFASSEARLEATFASLENRMQTDLQLRETERGILREGMILTVNDARTRLGDTILLRGVVVTATGAVLIRAMGRKVVQRAAVQGAAKAGRGALGGAVSGASTGAVCGPWCAFIGGIVGWVATDKLIVEADELLNRDDFEAEILHLIREQHATMKFDLKRAYRETYREIEALNASRLRNVRIRDQIG